MDERLVGPIAASYPNCTLASIANLDQVPPELFPILCHGQFEALLTGTFVDPVSGILRAVRPEKGIAFAGYLPRSVFTHFLRRAGLS